MIMSDIESFNDKVTIHVLQSKGLQGSKGNQLTAIAKVEFSNTVLGESPKVETNTETGRVLFDFKCDLTVNPHDPLALDELAQTPVVVTLTEILPKDKKSKEEKTNVLGQTCIDLLPLLKGSTSYTIIEHIHPVNNTNELAVEQVLAEIEISISTTKPLLTYEQLESCNLLTVCVESAFSIPEAWHHNGSQCLYAACMPIPITNEKETMVLIPNGCFRAAGEKEMSVQRRWSCVPNASGSCLYIPNTEIQQTSYEEENGDFRTEEDIQFRLDAENNKPHITWNAERRSFLGSVSTECLQQKIALHRYWPLEIMRTLQPTNVKSKGKDEDIQVSYHGIIYVDLAPLLYPGVRKIRGAYLVHPYNENEAQEKLQRKGIMTEEVIKAFIGVNSSTSSLGQTKAGVTKQLKAESKVKPSAVALKVEGAANESPDLVSQEGQQYVEAKTYIVLELELEKPLVAKRKKEEVAARVAVLIPPRPAFPKKEGGSKKAIQDFEKEICKAADQLLEEFREMFGSENSLNAKDADQRRKAFFYELNTSGKYFAFKERLKFYVVKIVREKFMYKTNFKTQEEKQAFISKLYIFLLDNMHKGLNKYLSTEEDVEVPPAVADSSMLKHFAKEAEVMLKYDLAAKYYQERIVQNEFDVECWYDYGIFCLLIDDMQRAEECFKQVVSLDQNHLLGLLMSGLMCLLHEEYTVAEELLDAATCLYSDEILPWTLLGFYYSGVENSIMAEYAFNEANKLLCKKPTDCLRNEEPDISQANRPEEDILEQAEEIAMNADGNHVNNEETVEHEIETETKNQEASIENAAGDHKSIFLLAAQFLLDSHVWQIAERALAHEVVTRKDELNVPYYETLGILQMQQKQYEKALSSFKNALVLRHENPNVWANKGHVYYDSQEFQLSKECYERSLAYTMDATDMYVIYIRLATIYLEKEKKYTDAKNIFLKACQTSPSCVTWLGTGIACYKLNELEEAEQALNEANILENKNAEVWAYLTLVCLKQHRHLEAEQCYKYAVKLGLCDHVLEQEIKTTMMLTDFDDSVL